MYEAKQAGKNTLMFFDPTMQKNLESHSRLISDLHQALKYNQFKLFFHPQVDYNKKIIGAEVLIALGASAARVNFSIRFYYSHRRNRIDRANRFMGITISLSIS